MTRTTLLFGIVLAVLFAPADAGACTCEGTSPPCEAVWQAAVVFSGEVVDIASVPKREAVGFMSARRVRLRVQEMWRGAPKPEITVTTGAGLGVCGYDFRPGGQYLVYAYSQGQVPWTGTCSRTQRLETATEDIRYLKGLQNMRSGGRIFGTATFSRSSWTQRVQSANGYGVRLRGNGREWSTKTDTGGRYDFVNVRPGTYEISIQLQPGEGVSASPLVELRDVRGCRSHHFVINQTRAAVLAPRVRNAPGVRPDTQMGRWSDSAGVGRIVGRHRSLSFARLRANSQPIAGETRGLNEQRAIWVRESKHQPIRRFSIVCAARLPCSPPV